MTSSDLEMMLPFPVTIVSHKGQRIITPMGPDIERAFVVQLQFQNTTIETDIQEEDPRYGAIKEHLMSVGRELS